MQDIALSMVHLSLTAASCEEAVIRLRSDKGIPGNHINAG